LDKKIIALIIVIILVILITGFCLYIALNENDKNELEGNLVVFCGIPVDPSDTRPDIVDVNALKEKYTTEYYIYTIDGFITKKEGVGIFAGLSEVQFEGINYIAGDTPRNEILSIGTFIASSMDISNYQREVVRDSTKVVDEAVIKKINQRYNVSVLVSDKLLVDLDNNGTNEKIITVYDKDKGFFGTILLSDEDKIECYLSVVKEGYQSSSYDFNGVIVDTDGNGLMEIYMSLPRYEKFTWRTLEYEKGNFKGENDEYIDPKVQ